jgi:hypothetical protein
MLSGGAGSSGEFQLWGDDRHAVAGGCGNACIMLSGCTSRHVTPGWPLHQANTMLLPHTVTGLQVLCGQCIWLFCRPCLSAHETMCLNPSCCAC